VEDVEPSVEKGDTRAGVGVVLQSLGMIKWTLMKGQARGLEKAENSR
jgi:hypothetical protein